MADKIIAADGRSEPMGFGAPVTDHETLRFETPQELLHRGVLGIGSCRINGIRKLANGGLPSRPQLVQKCQFCVCYAGMFHVIVLRQIV